MQFWLSFALQPFVAWSLLLAPRIGAEEQSFEGWGSVTDLKGLEAMRRELQSAASKGSDGRIWFVFLKIAPGSKNNSDSFLSKGECSRLRTRWVFVPKKRIGFFPTMKTTKSEGAAFGPKNVQHFQKAWHCLIGHRSLHVRWSRWKEFLPGWAPPCNLKDLSRNRWPNLRFETCLSSSWCTFQRRRMVSLFFPVQKELRRNKLQMKPRSYWSKWLVDWWNPFFYRLRAMWGRNKPETFGRILLSARCDFRWFPRKRKTCLGRTNIFVRMSGWKDARFTAKLSSPKAQKSVQSVLMQYVKCRGSHRKRKRWTCAKTPILQRAKPAKTAKPNSGCILDDMTYCTAHMFIFCRPNP